MQTTILKVLLCSSLSMHGFSAEGEKLSAAALEKALKADHITDKDIFVVAKNFQAYLDQVNFDPNEGVAQEILNSQKVAAQLIESIKTSDLSMDTKQSISIAVKNLLTKIDSSIEENYKFQKGTANIFPPAGTPNAAAGMNPDAIEDPELRRQYLNSYILEAKKQSKNNQQIALNDARRLLLIYLSGLQSKSELSKDQVIEQFTPEGKSRVLLREKLSPVGEK